MLRTWTDWIRGKRSSRTPARRRPTSARRRTRLGVEALETRELLSATVPGFTLDNSGNLYHTTASGPQLIDTGVQNFAVVNNQVYDLHTAGTLESMNSDGTGKAILATNVHALGQGADGNAYYLVGSNVYSSADSSQPWDTDVAAMAVTASGVIYELGTGSNLYWQNPATGNWASVAGQNVRALGAGADGDAYYLLNGNVYSSANSSQPWDTGIAAMAVTARGVIYEQGTGSNLYWQNPATGAWASVAGQNVRALGQGADGNAYYLLNGNVYSSANSSQPWDTGIASMAVTADGVIYELGTGGNLYWQNPATGGRASVAGQNVQALGEGADGNAYYLVGSNVYSSADSSQPWDTYVAAMAVTAGGVIYELGTDSNLYWQNPATGNWASVAGQNVRALGAGADGNAYYLLNSNVYSSANRSQPWDTGIATMAATAGGVIYEQSTAGKSYWQNPATGARATIQGFADNGNLYFLQNNNLEMLSPNSSIPQVIAPSVNQLVVDGSGAVFVLEAGAPFIAGPIPVAWFSRPPCRALPPATMAAPTT
jgi:gentisate 1,2-dioxygenase